MKTIKKGGDLLGKGAYGCVFNIEFPCKKKKYSKRKRYNRKYISKKNKETKRVFEED